MHSFQLLCHFNCTELISLFFMGLYLHGENENNQIENERIMRRVPLNSRAFFFFFNFIHDSFSCWCFSCHWRLPSKSRPFLAFLCSISKNSPPCFSSRGMRGQVCFLAGHTSSTWWVSLAGIWTSSSQRSFRELLMLWHSGLASASTEVGQLAGPRNLVLPAVR